MARLEDNDLVRLGLDPYRNITEQLVERIEKLEKKRKLSLNELPLAALRRHLDQQFSPDGDGFLLPESVGNDSLEAGAVNTRVLAVLTTITFSSIAAANAPNNSLFQDSADGKLKFKDNGGVVNALY